MAFICLLAIILPTLAFAEGRAGQYVWGEAFTRNFLGVQVPGGLGSLLCGVPIELSPCKFFVQPLVLLFTHHPPFPGSPESIHPRLC